jgi:hypothetical protein
VLLKVAGDRDVGGGQIIILDSKDFGERRGKNLFLNVKLSLYIVGNGKVNISQC